ncbi:phage tail protein [Aliiroseovarius sp. YM-037]|uniref:phage tail protein n=1 Tax=Aliiroseovarius sp. YM-037 TaxID=3341728 RepID=UPI003A80E9E9
MSNLERQRVPSAIPQSTLTSRGLRSGAALIASEPLEVQTAFLDDLDEGALSALLFLFQFWAMDHQMPPDGDWKTWVILGGRGAGKTRAGAEWVRSEVEGSRPLDPGRSARVALVGETIEQVREVMIFGDSGILACSPPDRKPEWQATRKRLVWPNGAIAQVFSAHEPESLRGPQFDAAWVDEFGCAAIDKGANQPNKFLDPKSSESSLPHYSDGRRDELMQLQYLRAMAEFWSDPGNNPTSEEYGVQMVDMSRAHVWAWDARPFPHFPNNSALWSDGENYARGHWLNGRTAAIALSDLVREICARSGVDYVTVDDLWGYVRGYAIDGASDARAALQSLMLAYGFDAVERDGNLVFRTRDGHPDASLDPERLALEGPDVARIEAVRSHAAELAGRVRLSFVEAEGDFAIRSSEAIFPDDTTYGVSQSELPLALTAADGRAIAERWLAESRVARDTVRFSLPQSALALGAGDVVTLNADSIFGRFRIDHVDQGGSQMVEATRVEDGVYEPSDGADDRPRVDPFVPTVPVSPIFLDLPVAAEAEQPHAPFLAVAADPWPGNVAVFSSANDSGYALNTLISAAATVGRTETPLRWARSGVVDRGNALRVRLSTGTLSSATWADVLNGANLAVIGDGSTDNWEIFQFEKADLVDGDTYDLKTRLRGQFGSDGAIPDSWPIGSYFILLNKTLQQIELSPSARDLARHYRIGPGGRPNDDPSYVHSVEAFSGIGLRPYSPSHLTVREDENGALLVRWTRRTRIDGDSWSSYEVPLGEERERYLVRLTQNGSVVREEVVSTPEWVYSASARTADGLTGFYEVAVAQISDRFGPGLFALGSVGA